MLDKDNNTDHLHTCVDNVYCYTNNNGMVLLKLPNTTLKKNPDKTTVFSYCFIKLEV